MNINFKVLWFEDEKSWFNMEKIRVDQIIQEHCLVSQIEYSDGSDFSVNDLTGNDYDLILLDYKLFNGEPKLTGDTIATEIRNNNILTDILFYSSDEKSMINAIYTNMPPIDGIYFTKRDYDIFTEKIKRLIAKIVKRSEDVVNLRGFVLDNTSDFEVRIKDILELYWEKAGEEQKDFIKQKVSSLLDSKDDRQKKLIARAKASDDIYMSAIKDKYLFSINDRLEILQEILNVLKNVHTKEFPELPKSFKQHYVDNASVYRNKLSHIRVGEQMIQVQDKSIPINQELHRKLRKNLGEINAMLQVIEKFIAGL